MLVALGGLAALRNFGICFVILYSSFSILHFLATGASCGWASRAPPLRGICLLILHSSFFIPHFLASAHTTSPEANRRSNPFAVPTVSAALRKRACDRSVYHTNPDGPDYSTCP